MVYIPDRGDVVWLFFDPQIGHEQAGRRPAWWFHQKSTTRKKGSVWLIRLTAKLRIIPSRY
jgi:mRNA interferase MazF